MSKKKIIVFASGTKAGGGSGFQKLAENANIGVLDAEIVAVVCNHDDGGVKRKAFDLGIEFVLFKHNWQYQELVTRFNPDLIVLSGWLKQVTGLDPTKTINIHPGPLPEFGGQGMYGHFVHEAVIEAFYRGEIKETAVSMHFVTEEYDQGPVFFRYPVKINPDDDYESLAKRVNKVEHDWQAKITSLVVNGLISWDGQDKTSLRWPEWYDFI